MSFIYVPNTSAISEPYGATGTVLTSAGTNVTPIWANVNSGAQGFVTQNQSVSTEPTFNSFSIAII
jgi:hypothetical protein